MKDCVFCKILNRELPCFKIYEDDFTLAFLDISNDIYGHTLVIPKKHVESVMTCDATTLGRLMEVCKKVGNHYVKDCGFDGFNIINCSGKAAEQSVFHLHFHILPRKNDDGQKVYPTLLGSGEELEKVCQALKIEEEEKNALPIGDEDDIILYTDGACSGNPGPGGWAAILTYKGNEKILSGGEKDTTNNRMELMAVISGLEAVKEGEKVRLFSDSAYVVNAFLQHWIDKWQVRNWRGSDGNEVLNKDLWMRLLVAVNKHEVEFNKVKGHSDNVNNNRCDAIARNEIAKLDEE